MSSPSKSESSKEQSPSLWAQIEDTVECLTRDTPQDGWHRLKWTSAFGKVLYMDVKAKSPGEMDMLCMQFSGRSLTEPSQSSESIPTSPNLASPIGEVSPASVSDPRYFDHGKPGFETNRCYRPAQQSGTVHSHPRFVSRSQRGRDPLVRFRIQTYATAFWRPLAVQTD